MKEPLINTIHEFIRRAGKVNDDNEMIALMTKLNDSEIPGHFNWVKDIYEGIHLKEHPSKLALIWSDIDTGEEEEYSYAELHSKANKLLNFLRSRGVGKGKVVYVMTPVLPELWVAYLSLVKGGMVIIPTATNLTPYELKIRFSESRPDVLIADEKSAEKLDESIGHTSPLRVVVRGKRDGWIPYDEVEKESGEAEAELTTPDDPTFNFFTSGTTGLPKRVIHTATSYPVGHISTAAIIGLSGDDVHLNLSAPGWAKFAWSSFFAPLIVGATVVGINYAGKLDSNKYLDAVESYGVTSFCAPPTAWRQFILTDLNKRKFEKLRKVLSAGEPLNPEIIKVWRDKFKLTIRDFYGQTETTAMIGNLPYYDVVPGSFGKPFPMYDVRLVDDNGNEVTKPFEVGHIVIRLDKWRPIGLFKGYSDPSKNEAAFRGVYYYTGDKAYFDEKGYWYFVGRGDDVIKTSDYRVGPFEVESALIEHPAVAEAAVVGSPDPVRWQVIKAFIVLKPGYTPSEDLARDIYQHMRKLLSSYKVPRIIEFVDELPKTISGKIKRNELRKIEEERRKKGERGRYEYFV
ncbi:acyl--CoA ligase [Stygiolobus caldivivus]|uniref:Acetyl-CoA synthetase n=1 Tax=Stygiolobus caldivivus TaxID=2824673 RepID=A0A8D5U9W4_9CREN|nr:acyl--CoA ligase [Stygiolobus caldivivus]BCU71543.1 acetyl-CoA synthetase [Stygiolobus caldivivus]